jgi:hypothetical protein
MALTWSVFVLTLKKIGLFFKNYGAIILLGIALVYALIFVKRKQDLSNDLLKQIQDQGKRHRDEVDALVKVHEEEVKRHAEIEKKYNETIVKIEQEHQQALQQLDRQKKQELHQIIETTNDDPDEMARRVNSLFGIPIYTPPN